MTQHAGRVDILGGIRDLVIMALLLVAAGGGGYLYGTFQKVAPVEYVSANTPGAVKPKLSKADEVDTDAGKADTRADKAEAHTGKAESQVTKSGAKQK